MMIATWNVNSLRARQGHVARWLETMRPDVLVLQELKLESALFPHDAFAAQGYTAVVLGQKSYNGVAIIARETPRDVIFALPDGGGAGPGGIDDTQARYIEATVGPLRIAGIYLPNGNPVGSEKFAYKLRWMDRLGNHLEQCRLAEMPLAVLGDFNVCPEELDVHDSADFADDALCRPESRARFRRIMHMGFTDILRAHNPGRVVYSYFDYQAGAWVRQAGLRIDHILLSPAAADRVDSTGVDLNPRGWEKPSDHCPVWCRLAL